MQRGEALQAKTIPRYMGLTSLYHLYCPVTYSAIGSQKTSQMYSCRRLLFKFWTKTNHFVFWAPWGAYGQYIQCLSVRFIGKLMVQKCEYSFFTSLHGMQTRSSGENSVRLSVRQTRGLWQNGRKICLNFYTIPIRKIIYPSFLSKKIGGGDFFYPKFWVNRPPLERNRQILVDIR